MNNKKCGGKYYRHSILLSYVVLLCLGSALLASCGKDSDNTLPDGAVRYKINGELITVHNQGRGSSDYALFDKQIAGTPLLRTNYFFQLAKASSNSLVFRVIADSLAVQHYFYDSTSISNVGTVATSYHNGQSAAILYEGDNIDIHITSYNNGFISGTFTAKLTPYITNNNPENDPALKGTTVITDGEFKNIQCFY